MNSIYRDDPLHRFPRRRILGAGFVVTGIDDGAGFVARVGKAESWYAAAPIGAAGVAAGFILAEEEEPATRVA